MVTLKQLSEKKESYFFPEKFSGRLKIDIDELKNRKSFRCDDVILMRRSPRERAEGQPEDKIYYSTVCYVPVTDPETGGAFVWVTSSEPVIRLAYSIGFDEFEDDRFPGSRLRICREILEGDLKIGWEKKTYGKKGEFPVPTIEAA